MRWWWEIRSNTGIGFHYRCIRHYYFKVQIKTIIKYSVSESTLAGDQKRNKLISCRGILLCVSGVCKCCVHHARRTTQRLLIRNPTFNIHHQAASTTTLPPRPPTRPLHTTNRRPCTRLRRLSPRSSLPSWPLTTLT